MQESVQVTPEKLIGIIGTKEIELVLLREQLVSLQQQLSILQKEKLKWEKEKV